MDEKLFWVIRTSEISPEIEAAIYLMDGVNRQEVNSIWAKLTFEDHEARREMQRFYQGGAER